MCCRSTTGWLPSIRRPAAIEDAYAAFKWACEHAGELGATPGRVAVGGDSAGGNLAAVVCQLARDERWPGPAAAVADLPADRLHRADPVAEPVRPRLRADQAGYRLVPRAST